MVKIIVLVLICIFSIIGLVVKSAAGVEIKPEVMNYNSYECSKVIVLDKKHIVYKIGDVENNKAYLYVTGEGTLYDVGKLVR